MSDRLYIQYGCGLCAPKLWRNFDSSPTLRFERLPIVGRFYTRNDVRFPNNVEFGDILKGLPVGKDSCDAVYCSHVLEHLSLQDFRIALQNTFEMLRPNGVFRFVVPDLAVSITKYIESDDPSASIFFLKETLLGRETRKRGFAGLVGLWLGNSEHLWMWDFKSLRQELLQVGFEDIRRATIGDSGDPMFGEVEESHRWRSALGINCRKPC
jgi:SAM-dependent methyltransferase